MRDDRASTRCSCTSRSRGVLGASPCSGSGSTLRQAAAAGRPAADLLHLVRRSCASLLETLRVDNWTFFGVPTAQIVSVLFVVPALLDPALASSAGSPVDDPATAAARRGRHRAALSRSSDADRRTIDEAEDDDEPDDDDVVDDDDEDDDDDDADDDADDDDDGRRRSSRRRASTTIRRGEPASSPRRRRSRRRTDPAQPDVPARSPAPAAAGRHRALTGGAGRSARRRGRGAGLARPPARGEGVAPLSAAAAGRPVRHLRRCSGSGSGPPGQEHLPPRRLPARRGGPPGLDGSVRRDARPPDRAAGLVPRQRRRRRSRRAGASGSIHRLGGLLPVWRGGIGIDQHVASARAVIANGARLRPDARGHGQRAARPDRAVPHRLGGHRAADRRADRAARDRRAPRSSTSAGGWRRGSCRPTTVASCSAGLGRRAAPAPRARARSSTLARRMSDAPRRRSSDRSSRRCYPGTVDPPEHPRRLRERLTWLLLRPGRLDRDG